MNKIKELRRIVETSEDDAVLLSFLDQAGAVILDRMYPYKDSEEIWGMEVPEKFTWKQIRIAAYLMNKRGAEGEVQHIENGIHRNYRDADVPREMLWDVLPNVGIPR